LLRNVCDPVVLISYPLPYHYKSYDKQIYFSFARYGVFDQSLVVLLPDSTKDQQYIHNLLQLGLILHHLLLMKSGIPYNYHHFGNVQSHALFPEWNYFHQNISNQYPIWLALL
jgi:hypothetical protein